VSAAGSADAGYLAVQTDDSTLGVNASNQLIAKAAGITATELATSVAGDGLAGGGGTALSVNVGAGIAISGDAVLVDTASSVTFLATTAWTFPNGTTAEGLFVTGAPVDANHVVNKTYVDNQVSGITWREPASVLEYLGTRTVAQIDAYRDDQGRSSGRPAPSHREGEVCAGEANTGLDPPRARRAGSECPFKGSDELAALKMLIAALRSALASCPQDKHRSSDWETQIRPGTSSAHGRCCRCRSRLRRCDRAEIRPTPRQRRRASLVGRFL